MSTERDHYASCTITVHITYEASQPWGDECQLSQLRKQAMDGARQKVSRLREAAAEAGIRLGRVTITNLRAHLGSEEGQA